MKKSLYLAAALFVFALLAKPEQVAAQKYQGQINFTGGASFSVTGLVVNTFVNAIDNVSNVKTRSTPGLNGMVDFGLSDRFSVGAAYYYQNFRADFNGYTDTIGNVVSGDYFVGVTRQNIGLRALFHFGDNDDLDIYAGARFGYTLWSYRTNATSSGLNRDLTTSRLWPQALFGMRYYFTENVGVNAEFAVGPPYYMMFGLNARFGGN